MSTITNPLRDQRNRIAADAVISAYINELGSSAPWTGRASIVGLHHDARQHRRDELRPARACSTTSVRGSVTMEYA